MHEILSDKPSATWDPSRKGALAGVHVLDLSRFIAGPVTAQNLGDLGADVIKVERIGGEDTRHNEPQYNGKSLYTAIFNRNKRGVTINTRSAEGKDLLLSLASWADVIVENFRPGTLEKMGLGPEALQAVNDDIIVVSISGFGQTGPQSDQVLLDCIAQAQSGLMDLNARADLVPVLTKIFPADSLAAAYATAGALGALYHREKTGEGQYVDLSVFDSLMYAIGTSIPAYLVNDVTPPHNGNRDDYNAPANIFPTNDGYVYLHAGTQSFWARLCADILERPELMTDPRFNTVSARMTNMVAAEAMVTEWTSVRPGAEVEATFRRVGIPCGIVSDIPQAAVNPQVWAREMLVKTTDTEGDEIVLYGSPLKFSKSPVQFRYAPPQVGEHTDGVLTEILGLSGDQIDNLREKGVI
ncbi:CaiB/BaiF CoA transferase family protein [Subtercola lobariae]|uniref:Formyl-CoA transferase n=1 Tax=Subtercola lobariae TaxID=1588641 RepID=A0A917B2C6_9MICO|nr:CoA transferase [Subtercola lobariae]GGF18229.1 formyl-CoA transferase [Subtercola lobariae]